MSSEILQPFQLASDGSVAATSDPNKQAQQHLLSLISTAPTERVMVPGYGVPIKATVFLENSRIVQSQLQNQITAALGKYEPNLDIQKVDVQDTLDPLNPVSVSVTWEIDQIQTGSSSGLQTATILIGGTVVTS
jgi:uncharacterized protein